MTSDEKPPGEFERRTREWLERGVARIDERTRSRLTQARFAAVEEAGRARRRFWHTSVGAGRVLVPAGALAAVLLVAMLQFTGRGGRPATVAPTTALEDVELLADGEALELIEDWDIGFYEWAASETDESAASG